jgi:hypothetical protein
VCGVGVGVAAVLDALCGDTERQGLPAGLGEECLVEAGGGVGGVEDLGGSVPPLGGALLEEAEGVLVAVMQVA